ncbi:sugar-binding transcriptional regulator [Nakamurella deserti]|uniref:sugar-binding transcriptional regulator n=1 Tax=Nakamurella deserti TaxID=2164074 RepID=UPI0013001793|nr:sugar-binding domain-containing protein [Nakamurella deserti]
MDDRLTVRSAYLYYRLGLTQAEVADRLGISRVKVGRLLASALHRGIVSIDIRHPQVRLTELEVALESRFDLKEAVVAASFAGTGPGEDPLRLLAVASAGARHLESLELTRESVALGWGTTMQAVSMALRDGWARDVELFQLNGAVPISSYATGAVETMHRFGERGRGRAHLLQVPAIVGRVSVRRALESEPTIRATLRGAREAPVAMFSLGRLQTESVLVSSGYIDEADVRRLRDGGAVGDVISRFITADGSVADVELDDRTMGLDLAALGTRDVSIGIAAGAAKAAVARAALAGGYLTTLIVDDSLATALLAGPTAD